MNKNLLITLAINLLFLNSFGQRKFSTEDALINSTIRIESIKKEIISGKEKYSRSTGTGFFFNFNFTKDISIPVIITNKHVIQNAIQGTLYFKLMDSLRMPIYGKTEKIVVRDFASNCIFHPDTTIDLAIYPIIPLINDYSKRKINLFFQSIPEDLIPNDSTINSLNAIEDIFMIGYPYGLRDTINDLPIVRRGITATPPYLDYNQKKEFLIDMPVYFGSSGSPIFIYNQGSWNNSSGITISSGPRVMLLGINYATYTKNFEGKILPIISESIDDSLKTNTPLPLYNIGIIIKAEKILEFKPILKKLIK